EQEREQFLQFITILLKECAEFIHVVLTLRSDFEPQFSEHPALKSEWVASRFVVPAMTREELRDVIEEPASTRVVYFEMDEQRGNLVDQLINEVAAMPGALPLLSFALSELYFKLAQRFHQTNTTGDIPDRVITWQDYDELGGATRSLTERADQVYDELILKDSAYAQTIQNVMLRMVNIDGGSATKRKVPELELKYSGNENDRVHQVLESYSTARLLVRGNDRGISYVEPAHDALIQGWQKLRKWIQAEGENLTLQRQLTSAAIEWQQKQQRRFLWHNNPRLALLKQKYVEQIWLNQLEQMFVQKSIRQHQQDTVRNWGIVATVVLLALGGTVFGRNAQINQMLDLQGSAKGRLLQNQNLEALIESIKAAKSLHHPLLQMFPPREALRNEVQETLQHAVYQVRERNRLKSDQGRINSVAFSPDGHLIATAQNNTVSFWDRSGKPLTGLNAPDVGGNIQKISFTDNSEYLVAEVLNQETNQIDAKRWNLTGALQLQEGQDTNSLGFNSSENNNATEAGYRAMNVDRTLVASSEIQSGTIFIYRTDPNSGQIQQQLAAIHNTPHFNSSLPLIMRFSPDSQRLAAASWGDNTIYLWDLAGNLLAQFKHAGGVQDLKFSPDSQQLATVGQDGIVRIWQHLEGSQQEEYRGYAGQDRIHTIQLSSANTNQVAIGTDSGRARLWDLNTQQETVLPIPASSVDGLRFSPDNRFLAIGSGSGQTWIWNLETQQISPDMPGPKFSDVGTLQRSYAGDSYWGGAFSPDRQWLVLGGMNPVIYNIFNSGSVVAFPKQPSVREGDRAFNWLQAFAFDPSEQILAAGGFDGQLELWHWKQLLATGGYTQSDANQQFKQEVPTDMSIQAIAFSPQRNLVATAGIDSGVAIVRLWDLAGQQQAELRGHEARINAVAFSPEGNRIATASEDGTVRLWSLNGQQLAVFKGHDAVKQVAFRSSEQLISAGFSSQKEDQANAYDLWQVKTWQIQNPDQLLEQGCSWVQGYLENSRDLDNKPEFQADRTLCQGISSQGSDQIAPVPIISLIPTELPTASMAPSEVPASPAIEPSPQATEVPSPLLSPAIEPSP
ncbi:MAG TPA: WD40 repeat domain-containing protein, partial [Coleofasciculaceae cyanobacterium]